MIKDPLVFGQNSNLKYVANSLFYFANRRWVSHNLLCGGKDQTFGTTFLHYKVKTSWIWSEGDRFKRSATEMKTQSPSAIKLALTPRYSNQLFMTMTKLCIWFVASLHISVQFFEHSDVVRPFWHKRAMRPHSWSPDLNPSRVSQDFSFLLFIKRWWLLHLLQQTDILTWTAITFILNKCGLTITGKNSGGGNIKALQ